MVKDALDVARVYTTRLRHAEATRKRAEKLFRAARMERRDIERLYAGLFLEAYTGLENAFEELFFGFIAGQVTHVSGTVSPNISVINQSIIPELVYGGGRHYANWLNYDDTKKRALLFLLDGKPFDQLDGTDKATLKILSIVRNAIAHDSISAKKTFIKDVIAPATFSSPIETKPLGYLRSLFISTPPTQTRYEMHILDMRSLVQKICS
ncbi:MAG: hypothetical protein WC880_05260 [Candidatus Paceibacterota bacterium]